MLYRFGPFELYRDRYRLLCGGQEVPVEPKILEVLALFLSQPGRLLTKEDLLAEVWQDQFVSDSAISRAVSEARRVLTSGPDGDAARGWIQTVYGRGFAYEGPAVERLDPAEEGADIVAQQPPPPETPASLTPLIGRESELQAVCDLLRRDLPSPIRLLTLTGTGGTGKTRLALEAARRSAGSFRDGTVFVPLSEVTTTEGLVVALARALEVSGAAREPLAGVRRHLATRQVLLVLDNFEQLVESAGVVLDLLGAGPHSVALVTSRFVLQLEGEQEWPVPPLALPDPSRGPGAAMPEDVPAVALFLARARAALPRLDLGEEDLAYVAEICRRLDGLPLAIELAAARIKVFSPYEIWQRLAATFDLLSSPARSRPGTRPRRHRSLEAALDWSYRLLAPEEQSLLRGLAVFAGDFPRSAVFPVCGADREGALDVLEDLAALLDRSFVVRLTSRPTGGCAESETRFRLLETTRAFALARLREAGDESTYRRAHAGWLLDLAVRSERELQGRDQLAWLRYLDAEHDQLLAALSWAESSNQTDDLEVGLRIASALGRYWSMRVYGEGRDALSRLLDAPASAEVADQVYAEASLALGMLQLLLAEYQAAGVRLDESVRRFRVSDDRGRLAEALGHLSWIAVQHGDSRRARDLSEEALQLHQSLKQDRGVSVALNNLAWNSFFAGNLQEADQYFVRSIEHRRKAGDSRGEGFVLINRAAIHLYAEDKPDHEAATVWLRDAATKIGDLPDLPLRSWLDGAGALLDLRLGASEKSIARMEACLELDGAQDNPEGLMWLKLILGRAHAEAGHPAEAHDGLGQALEAARTIGSKWVEEECLRRLEDLNPLA